MSKKQSILIGDIIIRKVYPSAALNIIWAVVGIVVIFGILFK